MVTNVEKAETPTTPSVKHGQVITFYSYKGGTGRTMALANVACLLARKYRVLMIDWDLEAPGLHRFFRPYVQRQFPVLRDRDQELDRYPGLIDLFLELKPLTEQQDWDDEPGSDEINALFEKINLSQFILPTDLPRLKTPEPDFRLDLMKSGRIDESYSSRINNFHWDEVFNHTPWLFRAFIRWLSRNYDYVLIDSRTGLTDTSGICTMIMPEKLVVVFTPNRQSLTGVVDLIERAITYRQRSEDLRPLAVFPLASRIEVTVSRDLRDAWRFGRHDIEGFQPQFEAVFTRMHNLSEGECELDDYFDQVQIQHLAEYAFGEEIAVEVERQTERLSLARAYRSFTERLENLAFPWERFEGAVEFPVLEEQQPSLDRKWTEALYRIFDHFFSRDQKAYYARSVARARRAASQVNTIRAFFSLLTGLSAALVGVLVATNGQKCAPTAEASGVFSCPVIVGALMIVTVFASTLSIVFTFFGDLFSLDRSIPIYQTALNNLESVDAISPSREMDDGTFLDSFQASAESALRVANDEAAQWGQLSRIPKFGKLTEEQRSERKGQSH